METLLNIKRGDIYYIDNDPPEQKARCVQGGKRPAVIISNDKGNNYSPVVIVAPLTTRSKRDLPTHVTTTVTKKPSIILCEQITTVSKEQLSNCIGHLTPSEIEKLNKAIAVSLALM